MLISPIHCLCQEGKATVARIAAQLIKEKTYRYRDGSVPFLRNIRNIGVSDSNLDVSDRVLAGISPEGWQPFVLRKRTALANYWSEFLFTFAKCVRLRIMRSGVSLKAFEC
jgi:hypothetical protein